jgi:hypothetical protein
VSSPGPSLSAVAACAAAIVCSTAANAFTVDGHDAIEAAAYRRLVAAPRVDDGSGETRPGKDVLLYLLRRGYLAKPRCFASDGGRANDACARDIAAYPLAAWPPLLSKSADLVSERQFSSNGQCFHFMAGTSYVWKTPLDPRLGVHQGFAGEAYRRCTRALTDLFVATLRDPARSNADDRGLYALMHAVADAFSAAHVERDRAGRVLYLKPWEARGVLTYLWPTHWEGLRYLTGPSHHAVIDGRDDDFVRHDDPACKAFHHAYALPADCLSESGSRAADALVDLLLLVHRLGRSDDASAAVDRRAAFAAFLARHLPSAFVAPDLRRPFWDEREWVPAFDFGFRFRDRPVPGATDLSAIAGAFLFADLTLPVRPFFSIEAGCRRLGGACQLELGADALTLLLPVTEGFALGVTPLSIVGSPGSSPSLSVGANVIRADLYLLDSLWVSASGPRYSWTRQAFDGEPFSISLGFAWNGKVPPLETTRTAREVPARVRADSRDLQPASATAWSPPPLGASYATRATTVVVHLLGATVIPDDEQGAYSIGGIELLWDRDRWGRRAGFALGGRADTELRRTHDGDHYGGVLGPVARYYLVPDTLAIEAIPALVDAGYLRKPTGSGAAFDVAAAGGLALMPFGRVELGLESPRLSYRSGGRVDGTTMGLRLGLTTE